MEKVTKLVKEERNVDFKYEKIKDLIIDFSENLHYYVVTDKNLEEYLITAYNYQNLQEILKSENIYGIFYFEIH